MKLRDLPIVRKLTLILAINVALAVLLITLVFTVSELLKEYRDTREQAQTLAAIIATNSQASLAFGDAASARETLASLQAQPLVMAARLYDGAGQPFAEYRSAYLTLAHAKGSLHAFVDTFLPVDMPIVQAMPETDGRLELDLHLSQLWLEIATRLAVTLLIALATIALVIGLGLRLRQTITEPLLALAAVSHQVSLDKDFSLRARKVSNDEIGTLVDDFNRMLAEIQARDQILAAERLQLEQRVRDRTAELAASRDEAQRANAAKSEFLSRMSHELRTPLNAVIGFAQLLEVPAQPPLSASQLDNVQEILKAGGHLVAMVNEILDLARIETGRIELRPETLAIAPLAEACLAQMRPLAQMRHITISTDLAAAPPVRADALRLRQVLLNLLSNAIKYNRDHGRIDLTARAEQDRLRVGVADSGRGIAPEQMARLFKPFERIETSYDGIGGTGIGLALVKRLVEAMDGEVGVTSIPGYGSTFWFCLPLASPETKGPT